MSEAPLTYQSKFWSFVHNRLGQAAVLAYQLIALVAFILIPFLALRWMNQPFLGVFVEHTLIINGTPPSQAGSWGLYANDLGFGYQIRAIGDKPVATVWDLQGRLSQYKVGDTVQVTLENQYPPHDTRTLSVVLQDFPWMDRSAYFFTPYLIGLAYLGCSLWVFGIRRADASGRAFSVFTTSVALGMVAYFDYLTTNWLVWLWTAALALASGSLINLSALFPHEDAWIIRHPYMRWLAYLPSFGLIAYTLPTLYDQVNPLAYLAGWRGIYAYIGIGLVVFLVWTFFRFLRAPSPITREQARLLLIASLSFGPLAIFLLLTIVWPTVLITSILFLPTVVFPMLMAYTILRYRMLNTDYLVSRVVLYTLMVALAGGGYALVVSGFSQIITSVILFNPYFIGALTFVLALLFNPMRSWLQKRIDAAFNRGHAVYQERLQTFGRDLTQVMELNRIVEQLRKAVQSNLRPYLLHVFVQDALTDTYIATSQGNGHPTSDLRFPATSALVQILASQRTALFLADGEPLPAALKSEEARINLLAARLYIPLPGRRRLVGWLALGDRNSGEPYTSQDLAFLESLCDQAALAVERAQVVGDLERRVHEMNVLTRVSQGLNITLAFDDMLELIYAQTNQVVPTWDFRITLRDSFSGILYHVFYLENDERISKKENYPLPVGQGLEQEIINGRRTIVTDDYERECRNRGVLPAAPGLYAWLGVPLNAGAETIGLLSLGSRDSSVLYTEEQVGLLQAIADQTAGAIVKARLLQESERRTRQLTSLNEVSRSMASTLDLQKLLEQILHSAVEILNCEAGSLLLVDEQTGEMVFEVVIGPAKLVGQRLPPGTGLVGKAVEARQPIIANDVRRTKEWFEKPDENTGFTTKDLLVVPMMVKDRVTGVVEVINHRDGLPFSPDDQELLLAFASQAAVALENARLYTMTDQSLAARVEELSMMQRIDRELNASLDVGRAMRITLEWAMRQYHAEAGLVGVVEDEGVRVMASQGYTKELADYSDKPMPIELPALRDAVQTGQHQIVLSHEGSGETLLAGVRSQVVIPIRRESQVIGVMLLESASVEAVPEDTMAFLSRLSDHAAIAIANARLYDEVSAANLAKSEFVSFVAHELKNPMTSIKGFTEFIIKGMSGPVSDMQASFLNTIRNNVDRMDTIVSDLNILTKIEVGKMRLEFKSVDIAEVLNDVVRSLGRQSEEREQKIVVNFPPDLPKVWADQNRLGQVLTNLVSNAIKYTPQKGTLTVAAQLTTETSETEGTLQVVHCWVQDTGIGISPEDQKKIFTPYVRTERSKEMASGTGLGLTITKSLVEMQGGRIWFESEVDKGTTFHFTVPTVETA